MSKPVTAVCGVLLANSQMENQTAVRCHCNAGAAKCSSEASHMLCQTRKDSVGVSLPCAYESTAPDGIATCIYSCGSPARVVSGPQPEGEAVQWDPPLLQICHQGPATRIRHRLFVITMVWTYISKGNRVEAFSACCSAHLGLQRRASQRPAARRPLARERLRRSAR